MADVDINPFGDHESRTEEPTGEDIPLDQLGGMNVVTHAQVHVASGEQETSFDWISDERARLEAEFKKDKVDAASLDWLNDARAKLEAEFKKDRVEGLYEILSKHFPKNQNAIYYDDFYVKDWELYYDGKDEPLTIKGHLRLIGTLKRVLGKNRIYNLGFDISKWLTPKQAAALNKAKEEMLSKSDVTKAGDIELIKISRNASTSIENLISHTNVQSQTDESIENSLRELSGFDKELKRIRGQLKLAVAKKLDLGEEIEKEKEKLAEIENPIEYTDDQHEEIENRIKRLNDELKARQEHISLLKGELMSQIMSFKEMIAKVLYEDTSLGQKIRTLFRE